MSKIIVIGGGPAGMFAAITAAEKGHKVVLIEKNGKLGKRKESSHSLYASGYFQFYAQNLMRYSYADK